MRGTETKLGDNARSESSVQLRVVGLGEKGVAPGEILSPLRVSIDGAGGEATSSSRN